MIATDTNITQSARIVTSCKNVHSESNTFIIDQDKLEKYLSVYGTDLEKHKSSKSCVSFPLRFPSPLVEVNFVCVWNSLRFGLGFSDLVQKATGKNASDMMLFGLLSLFMGDNNLDVQGLLSLNAVTIASAFNLEITKEKQIMTGVYADEPTPLHPIATAIKTCLHDMAERLQACGASSLGQFVVGVCGTSSLENAEGKKGPSAQHLAAALASAFPVFDDTVDYMNGVTESHSQAKVAEIEDSDDVNSDATPTSVPMYSKVQRTCLELYHRFRAADPKCFDFADVDTICFSAAPTVALSLLQHKVITPRNETDDTIARWSQSGKTVLASDPLVVQLRAASVCAVESLATRTKIPRYEISHFLSEQHRKSKGSFRINAIPCRDTFAW